MKGSWLDRFIPLPENRTALHAVQTLAERVSMHGTGLPASQPNGRQECLPHVVLHGTPGSGKTHLTYVFAELVAPASCHRINARDGFEADARRPLDAKLTESPALVVEDVQFVPPSAVERCVQLLDERRQHGLATLVTSGAGPGQLRWRGERIPARLTSRLSAGLVIALEPLKPSSRRIVVDQWLAQRRLTIDADQVAWLAEKARGFRALESAVGQIELLRRMHETLPRAELIREHLEKHLDAGKPSVDRIAGHVAGHFCVQAKELRSRVRRRAILVPRQVSMYLARQLTPLSLAQIGDYFGGCDHSTVLHACRKVESAIQDDVVLNGTVRQLHDELC
jgi:chromosomal replication initiator protein